MSNDLSDLFYHFIIVGSAIYNLYDTFVRIKNKGTDIEVIKIENEELKKRISILERAINP